MGAADAHTGIQRDLDGAHAVFDEQRFNCAALKQVDPALVLSGSDLEIDRFQAMRLGAREYHVKSASLDATVNFLKDASERWLKPAASSGEVTAPRAHCSSDSDYSSSPAQLCH